MGGNSTYNKTLGVIPLMSRTHFENGNRIDGHKIIVQKQSPHQVKVPMNSNSDSPIYLCASVPKDHFDKIRFEIKSIGIYERHRCVAQIDLKFDKNGNFIPYSNTEKSSQYHKFSYIKGDGTIGRKSHDNNNHHPIPTKYHSLIEKIEKYNKEQKND